MGTVGRLPVSPDEKDAEAIRTSRKVLARHAKGKSALEFKVTGSGRTDTFVLPAKAVAFLDFILEKIAEGDDLTVVADDTELTVYQAAEILGVTYKFAGSLVEDNRLPHRVESGRPMVRMADVLAFREEKVRKGEAHLDKITAESEEMGLYDH